MDVYNFFQDPSSRTLLHRRYALQAALGTLFPESNAFRICLKQPIPHVPPHVVKRSNGSYSYGGLRRCACSWGCGHCAASLSEVRRKEVEIAIRSWRGERYGEDRLSPEYDGLPGKELRMILFTVPHQFCDDLKSLLYRFLGAFGWMRRHKSYRVLCKEVNLFGTIYVLEVTYGCSGWHPHIHMIWFFDSTEVDECYLGSELFPLWQKAASRFDFGKLSRGGFGIKDADFVSSYVTKFGFYSGDEGDWLASHELSKWFLKRSVREGLSDGLTPFDLLELHLSSICFGEEYGRVLGQAAGPLFSEFFKVFTGRHQLRWSKGLKRYFGIQDMSDEEASSQAEQEGLILQFLSPDQWRDLVKTDSRYDYLASLH